MQCKRYTESEGLLHRVDRSRGGGGGEKADQHENRFVANIDSSTRERDTRNKGSRYILRTKYSRNNMFRPEQKRTAAAAFNSTYGSAPQTATT